MHGKTHVLIRYRPTDGHGLAGGHSPAGGHPAKQQSPKLVRVTLAALPTYMWGRDIRCYQYAAGSDWHDFTQADTRLMRGEVEARMQQAVAEFRRRQQAAEAAKGETP